MGDDVNYRPRTMEVVADIHRANNRASLDVISKSRAVSTGTHDIRASASLDNAVSTTAVRQFSQPSRPGATSRQSVHSNVDGDVNGRRSVNYGNFQGQRHVAMEGQQSSTDGTPRRNWPFFELYSPVLQFNYCGEPTV